MDDDGIETVYHGKDYECPPGLHDDVPIVRDNHVVGMVCLLCGRSVYEDRSAGDYLVTNAGSLTKKPWPGICQ